MLEFDYAARWNTFFEENYDLIDNLKIQWPEKKVINVDHLQLVHFDEDFAIAMLENPASGIDEAQHSAKRILTDAGHNMNPTIRLKSLPGDYTRKIRSIRDSDMGKLISVEGIVTTTSGISPRIVIGHYVCSICAFEQKIVQQSIDEENPPNECSKFHGGCGRTRRDTTFELIPIMSKRVNHQFVTLQEAPDDVEGCVDAQRLTIIAEGDLVNANIAGQRVKVSGVPFMQATWKRNRRTPVTEIILQAKNLELVEERKSMISLDPKVVKEIVELSENPHIIDDLIGSFAPSIFGMRAQKESILLQLVGGTSKVRADGSTRRGSIHILMMGDPGVAKSQLLDAAARISPRGRTASGRAASGVGLTASAEQDKRSGRWYLKAGVMVAADGGLAAIDEFDKMREEDRASMHDAMAQQEVNINKAGISAKLNTRCSVLAAANPIHGHFKRDEEIMKQVKLPSSLLSRFDLIWLITDEVDNVFDRKIAEHILGGNKSEKPALQNDFLRAYISYASMIEPNIPKKVGKLIIDAYVDDRKKMSDGYTPMTHRALEALQRLTEASAKLHLREEATPGDAERAIRLVRNYIHEVM